ncbi:hypothetical protein NXW48_09575 [Phocaeicola vulgatus]|nr:hypothetical protein [Phocaeicola vulgatus]
MVRIMPCREKVTAGDYNYLRGFFTPNGRILDDLWEYSLLHISRFIFIYSDKGYNY